MLSVHAMVKPSSTKSFWTRCFNFPHWLLLWQILEEKIRYLWFLVTHSSYLCFHRLWNNSVHSLPCDGGGGEGVKIETQTLTEQPAFPHRAALFSAFCFSGFETASRDEPPTPRGKRVFTTGSSKKNHVEILKGNVQIAHRRPTADQTLAAPRVQVFSSEGSVGIGGPVAGEPTWNSRDVSGVSPSHRSVYCLSCNIIYNI